MGTLEEEGLGKMNTQEIQTLFAYNTWANHRILGAVRGLEAQDFIRDLRTSYSSVRGTLVHILWAEWLWLQRWQGESPKRAFRPEEMVSEVLGIFAKTVFASLIHRASEFGAVRKAQCGRRYLHTALRVGPESKFTPTHVSHRWRLRGR